MIKKILVPTDGSAPSKRAFKTALDYAKVFKAEIKMLHVVPMPPLGLYDVSLFHVTDEQLDEIGKQIMDEVSEGLDFDGTKVDVKAVSGYPAAEIIKTIDDDKIDLVIIGSRGRSPLAGALLGSVTQNILSGISCPVMVVK